MTRYKEDRAREFEDNAEAIRAEATTVTVELSLPAAWLLRDLIGLTNVLTGPASNGGVSLQADMLRLNAALPTHHVEDKPHVSRWAKRIAERLAESLRRGQ